MKVVQLDVAKSIKLNHIRQSEASQLHSHSLLLIHTTILREKWVEGQYSTMFHTKHMFAQEFRVYNMCVCVCVCTCVRVFVFVCMCMCVYLCII